MAHAAFTDAIEFLDWLEVESNSSVAMKDKTQILKLELRFLSTFLKYTVNRCTEYEDLQHLFTRIGEVGQNINKLASSSRQREVDGAIRDLLEKIRLIRPHISGVQMKVVVNPNTREVQMEVYRGASGSGSFIRYELVVEFIATLQEDLEELLACEVNLLQPSLKEGIKILKRKLKFLKGLFGFTAKRCSEHDKLYQLFIHVQAVADNAAYLAYSCLINEMGEDDMARILALELSNLVQKIDPVKPEVREIYIGVVKASKSSESRSNTYETDETAVDFVDSLLENTTELLLYRDIMPVKDQIQILHVELTSLKYFLKDVEKFTKPGKSIDLLAHAEVTAIDAGSVIYSLFDEAEVNQDIAEEMSLALSKLLDKFKLGKGLVRKMMYVNVEKANISNFPRTDELGALDLLLQNLKELLNDRVDSITLLKDHIQIVRRDMEFLRSFMAKIAKRHYEHEKREDIWRRIIHVMYEIEYVIDSVMVKDGPILHQMLWLSDLIEEIKLIKKEINELLISDKNIHGLQEDDVAKISRGFELSQFNAPRIDEEMVGFKDEEEKVVEQLVWGSRKLQIVSIVGMPGLGKTFLAQKVYNIPLIKDYFDVRAWCSVSQVYEREELLINILSQMMETTQVMSECTVEELAEMLYKCLKRQRYFIVLDDMWDIGAWNALARSFPDDHNGSRIVFTSQSSELALEVNPSSILHRLRPFSDEESWELLRIKIFQRESCPSELLEVGQEIAKSCNGLPLAVVVVAGLLARIGNEQERWRKVARSLSSYIIDDRERWWMDILDLSYKHLPDYLKPCFLYFGVLSENKQIPVAKLTWLWIAEGFVRGNQPNLENIAESYLMDLIDRSLIIASGRRSTGGVKACLIHELIRNFCVSQINASRIDEEMVGFKDEEEKVVEKLVGSSAKRQIVSIVGMPGLGKTFLAQKVYNNPTITNFFYVRAWCRVSEEYEKKELLINILSQVKKFSKEMSEKTENELAEELYKCLKGQRYLIVLDDIWDIGPWNALARSFPDDHNGSRIVFTSQSSSLALDVNPSRILHHLRPFSDEESWELLQKKIFQGESCPTELLGVGRKIAKSCSGLPLAVVVVAGLLARIGNEKEQWIKVADSLNSNMIGDRQRWWMNILDLSYKNLPDYLKPCFLYFGGLSEDKQIPVAKLTWLWIAEGFVRGNQPNLEKIAEGYLIDLIDRSLIIASERRSTGGVKACLIHDLIRNFCVSKAKEESFLKLIEGCGDLLTSLTSSTAIIPSSSYSSSYEQRRLFVHHRQNKKFWSKSSGPCVRSLLFFAPGRKRFRPDEVSSIFQGFKLLKVLDMMHIDLGATFPEGLELLALLRYLAVSGKFSSLPPSITNFRKLENFLVRAVHLSLPNDILNLSKLRHLHINGSMSLGQLSSEDPPSQLDCLQTLSKPILSYGDNMKKMRRFPNLKKLSCEFEESWDSSTNCNRLPILDFLKQLESLKVSYRGEMRHPCEFSLPSSIKKLTMSGFRLPWEQISIVGQLRHLEVLKLVDEAFEGEEWIMEDEVFPKLKFLKLQEMNFREWDFDSTDCFPCLAQLTLEGCRQLEDIPSCFEGIVTLEMIQVEECRESVVNAVRRIQEEQLEFGNVVKIEIKHRSD